MANGSQDGTNEPFAIDTDFDGDGECGAATTLSHRTDGTEDALALTMILQLILVP